MATIIIFGIIGLIIAVIQCWDEFDGFFEVFLSILSIILGIMIGTTIGLLIAVALPAKLEVVKTTYYLEALQDNNSVHGSFFLGSGVIDSRMSYVFYYQDSGYYKLGKVDYTKARVKYTEEKPKVERFEEHHIKGAIINYFALDAMLNKWYIIHIPVGSIRQNYTLDAQ